MKVQNKFFLLLVVVSTFLSCNNNSEDLNKENSLVYEEFLLGEWDLQLANTKDNPSLPAVSYESYIFTKPNKMLVTNSILKTEVVGEWSLNEDTLTVNVNITNAPTKKEVGDKKSYTIKILSDNEMELIGKEIKNGFASKSRFLKR